jgi:transposase
MPTQYVKPYVKRGKNEAADAEAICEAVARPTMRIVGVMNGSPPTSAPTSIASIARLGGAGEIDVEDLAVHDEGDFLGGQRLLAF